MDDNWLHRSEEDVNDEADDLETEDETEGEGDANEEERGKS